MYIYRRYGIIVLMMAFVSLFLGIQPSNAAWNKFGGPVCGGNPDPDCVDEIWAFEDTTMEFCADGARIEFAVDVASTFNGGFRLDQGFDNPVLDNQRVVLQPLDVPIVAGNDTFIYYHDVRVPYDVTPNFAQDVDLLVFGGNGGGQEIGNFAINQSCTISDSVPVNPQPAELGAYGNIRFTPAEITFTWNHKTVANQTSVAGNWYQVYALKDGVTFYQQWYEAANICTGVVCAAPYQGVFLPNGDYEFWVQAYNAGDGSFAWSDFSKPGEFTIRLDKPDVIDPLGITVAPREGRPIITWENDYNVEWYQVYIGLNLNGPDYIEWHYRDDVACDFSGCILEPDINFTADGNPYQVWIQGIGPGGYTSPDGTDGVAAWTQGPDLVLPTNPPDLPVGLNATPVGDDIAFSWVPGDSTTWMEVIVYSPTNNTVEFNQWFLAGDLGCMLQGEACTINESHMGITLAPGDYTLYIRPWGPAGFATPDQYASYDFTN